MSKSKYCYVSVLSSESYLDGVLALNYSLAKTKPKHDFLVLVTNNLPKNILDSLSKHNIAFTEIQDIDNPTIIGEERRWNYTYPKLNIFGLNQFDKLVYLDADMLILENIDELFDKPHMSAVNAGGMLPDFLHWQQLNSGIMVVEPSTDLLLDMLSKVGKIEKLEAGLSGSDQDFIQAYYPDWPNQTELHLDHGFNMFPIFIEQYKQLFGYDFGNSQKPIKILHYVGEIKPWHNYNSVYKKNRSKRALKGFIQYFTGSRNLSMKDVADELWFKQFEEIESMGL